MGDEGKEKGGNRVVQEFAISPAGSGAKDQKPTSGDRRSIPYRGAGPDVPDAEVITSEYVDSIGLKIAGRHGG